VLSILFAPTPPSINLLLCPHILSSSVDRGVRSRRAACQDALAQNRQVADRLTSCPASAFLIVEDTAWTEPMWS